MSKKFSLLIILFISIASVITWVGCREEQDGINSPTATLKLEKVGNVQLSFDKTAAANSVDTVTALLTRSGFESVLKDIAIGEGIATGTIFNVAEGKWLLTVEAKDSTGAAIYRGRKDVDILNSQTTYVSIELAPASTTGDLEINVSWKEGDGINWTVYSGNPVLDIGTSGEWDDDYVSNPSVIYNGTSYEMWYQGYDGTSAGIGYATSSDGINWTKYSGNPILMATGTPSVIFNGIIYQMWYGGISYATSSDGINWDEYSGNPVLEAGISGSWEDTYVSYPSVIYNGTSYEIWYIGYDGSTRSIGYASSPDGINWTKYDGNPVLELGEAGEWDDQYIVKPNVIYHGNSYKMWYAGHDNTNWRIGYATSIDGINWTKYSGNPILSYGTTDSWNDSGVLSPSVLYNGISYKLWFVGGDGINQRIGYAASP